MTKRAPIKRARKREKRVTIGLPPLNGDSILPPGVRVPSGEVPISGGKIPEGKGECSPQCPLCAEG